MSAHGRVQVHHVHGSRRTRRRRALPRRIDILCMASSASARSPQRQTSRAAPAVVRPPYGQQRTLRRSRPLRHRIDKLRGTRGCQPTARVDDLRSSRGCQPFARMDVSRGTRRCPPTTGAAVVTCRHLFIDSGPVAHYPAALATWQAACASPYKGSGRRAAAGGCVTCHEDRCFTHS